ncbi:hypothetical protein WOLCODRAFT_151835 [Wolfiporia cocos MD-104 SS10]|uniref:SH3 domain-containing protein n=1 Tax=Wolfiporia cocos (strain MD-104) TaxID=742152 RepID=A0A2H3JHX4_WOLCO|nr:hypothetical protein WOLCODRAFT_151835 [Wolfiporia cocos MD-104 SS10]
MASAAAQSDNTDVSVPRLSLSVDHPPSTSPFPSPGSPFLPPPRLSAHEFALRTSLSSMRSSAHKRRDDEHPPALAPTPPDDDPTPTAASMKTAFPRSGPSPPASPLPHAPAQPPRPSPPPTPLITIPDPEQGPHAALTSSRPAPPSPALSRRTSAALSRRSSQARSRRQSRIPPQHDAEPSSSSTVLPPQPKRRSLLVKIRDFAFAPSDERHVGRGPDVPRPNRPRTRSSMYSSASSSSSSAADDDAEDARGGWGSFRWNTLSSHFSWGSNPAASSDGPSRTDFERNFDMSSPTEEATDQYADDDDGDEGDEGNAYPSEDGPLVPGLYRAMFVFEPEGTAEMALEEEQVVRVVGRGGGVGWAVVEKEGGGHALVPESYLELVQADPTD